MRHTETICLTLLLATLAPLAGCSNGTDGGGGTDACKRVTEGAGPQGTTSVRTEKVVGGLEIPWGIVFIDADDMLVSERGGQIRRVQDGTLVSQPVADVSVELGGEGGLLDIQAAPDFDQSGTFYVYLTAESDGSTVNRVERWKATANRMSASKQSVIVDDIPAGQFHNGGRLRIGPDQKLYIGTGDARTPDNAQNRDTKAGKILRVNLDGSVPDDNPWSNNPAYLTGIRNTQGFDWLSEDRMLVTDHGPSGELGRTGHDEVSIAKPGDNLGWPTIYKCQSEQGMVTPILTWKSAVPPGGAALYTGDAISDWQGDLLVGALGFGSGTGRHLHRVELTDDGTELDGHAVYLNGAIGRIRDVTMGPDDHLYVTTSNCDGRGNCPDGKDAVYRIVPASK